ncbi:MAG: argininosuccinate lyase, partial [Sediminibacterium sp.]
FREAYQQIGNNIADGSFQPHKAIHHTHEGSIGQLCNEKIREQMQEILGRFPLVKIQQCLNNLAGTR